MKFQSSSAIAILALATFGTAVPAHSAAPQQITMWSNWPDEPAKKDWVSARVHPEPHGLPRPSSQPLSAALGIHRAAQPGKSSSDRDRSEERRVGKECRSRWS